MGCIFSKVVYTLLLIVLLPYTIDAQFVNSGIPIWRSSVKIPGVQIGQLVPDVFLGKIVQVDGSVKSGSLSDYKNQLLILDFMSTGCSACVTGLVKKNDLQQQFKDKVKILVVIGGGYDLPSMLKIENEPFIKNYLTSKNYLAFHNVKIPWVVENKALNDYFPHVFISHLVWINKGKVVAITEQDYVTAENIQFVLDGEVNDWPVKNDFLPPVDVNTPLPDQFPHRLNRLIAQNKRSFIFGVYQDGSFTKHGVVKDSINRTRRDYAINTTLLNLYFINWYRATGNLRFLQLRPSRIILEVKKPSDYISPDHPWKYNNVRRRFTYLSVEFNSVDTGQTEERQALYKISEIDSLLGLKGRFERRKINCMILYCIDSAKRFKSIIPKPYNFNASRTTAPEIHFNNEYMRDLVYEMNEYYGNPPVFDETGYKGLIDMKLIITSWKDISSIRKALKPYGLALKSEQRELEVFVLSEKKV